MLQGKSIKLWIVYFIKDSVSKNLLHEKFHRNYFSTDIKCGQCEPFEVSLLANILATNSKHYSNYTNSFSASISLISWLILRS